MKIEKTMNIELKISLNEYEAELLSNTLCFVYEYFNHEGKRLDYKWGRPDTPPSKEMQKEDLAGILVGNGFETVRELYDARDLCNSIEDEL